MSVVFFNGDFIPAQEAKIPINDRGFLFGDGAFVTLRVFNGAIESYSAHLGRLANGCQQLHLVPPVIKIDWLRELVARNHAFEGAWRLKIIVTGGTTPELNLAARSQGQIIMMLQSYKEEKNKPYRLLLYPDPISCPSAKIKALSYLDRLWVRDFARKREYDDAIMSSAKGFILETAFSNIFWRRENNLFIPDPELPYYHGVAIDFVVEAAKHLGMQVHYARTNFDEISSDFQIYTCNAIKGICPAYSVGENFFERDLIFERHLHEVYHKIVKHSSLLCAANAL